MPAFTRREFLQFGALASLGMNFDWAHPSVDPFQTLGRVTTDYLRVRIRPSESAQQVGWHGLDDVIRINDTVRSDGHTWHELTDGYVETNEVQPVENQLNPVVPEISKSGFIGQVTVPFAGANHLPTPLPDQELTTGVGTAVEVVEA